MKEKSNRFNYEVIIYNIGTKVKRNAPVRSRTADLMMTCPVGPTSHALYQLSYESRDWCSVSRRKILKQKSTVYLLGLAEARNSS